MNPAIVSKYNGRRNVSYDGIPADAGQCVQLVELIARDDYGAPLPVYPDAAAYWEYNVPGYTKIPVAREHPKAGDFVIWNRSLAGAGGHGHIDVCIEDGNNYGFVGLDSNWTPYTVTEVQHTYANVSGYLRKENDMSTVGEIEFHELYEAFFGPMSVNQPTDSDRKRWVGGESNTVIRAMQDDPRHPAWLSYIEDLKKGGGKPTPLSKGIYQVN